MFKSVCGAVLGVAIVATADFALAQLTHVGSLATAAKEFAQRSALLAQAGDREGAVEASRKAVDDYRRLVHASRVHYEPGLAASLHDLSLRLNDAGDTAGARAAIEEAIVIRRRLARYGARYVWTREEPGAADQHRDGRACEREDRERHVLDCADAVS